MWAGLEMGCDSPYKSKRGSLQGLSSATSLVLYLKIWVNVGINCPRSSEAEATGGGQVNSNTLESKQTIIGRAEQGKGSFLQI